MEKTDITPDIVRKLIKYDPISGELTWLARDVPRWWNNKLAQAPALNNKSKAGYKKGTIYGFHFTAHRVAWAIYHGCWPLHQIDHINGDRADNRLANLASATPTQNAKNRAKRKNNTSGATGVYLCTKSRRWYAQIKVGGNSRHLGFFQSIEAAARARQEAAKSLGFSVRHGL